MNLQPSLFDAPVITHGFARASDPDTSKEAAKSVDATALEAIVLAALTQRGSGTTEQIEAWTGQSLVTVSPRMRPLEVKGLVARIGKTKNRSGKLATIWKAVR